MALPGSPAMEPSRPGQNRAKATHRCALRPPDPAGSGGELTDTEALLASRLVMVTGKGGTGKTTFAAALALVAASRGQRVLLCEVDAQRSSLPPIFGCTPEFRPRPVPGAAGLEIANLTFREALKAFLVDLVPSSRVVRLILENAAVQRFLDFTPGSREMVALSAIAAQVGRYDLVVVDMPASGHAFSLLDITRSALGLFRSGPMRRRAAQLRRLLLAPETRLALVALPEEMVVNETLETTRRLREYDLLGQVPVVFLNRALAPTYTEGELHLLRDLAGLDLDPLAAEFVRAGTWEKGLEQGTAHAIERLREVSPPVLVPRAQAGSSAARVVREVAVVLGREVGVTRRELLAYDANPAPVPVRPSPTEASHPEDPAADWLDEPSLIVCVGAGGVGKTTTAASLGVQAALRGRKVIVLTIDPARRLANSLGLEELGNQEQRIALDASGELWAMMLDPRHTFHDLITRIAPHEQARQRILRNHVYRHLSDTFAGSQDYMAAEKLHDLVTSGRWDLVVLDTPPVKNALDFLESPGRLVHFLDERILRWFLHPYESRSLSAGGNPRPTPMSRPRILGGRLRLGTSAVVQKLLGYVFGSDFLDDLAAFFTDFQGLYDGFQLRHQAVLERMRAPDTAFLTVCSPTDTTLDVAFFFLDELEARGFRRAGVVVNQVQRCEGREHDAAAFLGAIAHERARELDLPDTVTRGLLARLGMAHRRMAELAQAEQLATAPLRARVEPGMFYVEIPRLAQDVHDLDGLAQLGQQLVGPPRA